MSRLPFDRVRSDVPLTDDDFAAIRASVMREIEPKERRIAPFIFRLAFISATIVLAVLLWPRKAAIETTPPIAAKPQPTVAAPALAPQIVNREPRTAVRAHRHVRGHKAVTQVAVARMEIQTADPDVRIIWITR